MFKWFKNRKLKKLSNNLSVRLPSTNVFFEHFDFYIKSRIAQIDAHAFNNGLDRIPYIYEHIAEIAKAALVDTIIEDGVILKK